MADLRESNYVNQGGTGRATHTAYAVLCGGTTTTAEQQSIAGLGTSGQVLTSNGAGALPTFQDAGGGSSPLTTKGDLYTYTTVDARLPIGGTSTRLIADSSGSPVWSDPNSYVYWNEDFLISRLNWYVESTESGSDAAQTSGEIYHPGVIDVSAGTTGSCSMRAQDRETSILFGGGFIRWEGIIMVPTLSDGTNRFSIDAGFGDQYRGTDQEDGIYFYYRDNSNSGQWIGRTESGNSATSVNSSITVTAGQWYHLVIEINAAATSVEFFVDGVSIGTSSTNIPSAAGIHFGIDETVGTTTRSMYVDYVSFYQELSTSRT